MWKINHCFNCGAEQSDFDRECYECGQCGVGYGVIHKAIAPSKEATELRTMCDELAVSMRLCMDCQYNGVHCDECANKKTLDKHRTMATDEDNSHDS